MRRFKPRYCPNCFRIGFDGKRCKLCGAVATCPRCRRTFSSRHSLKVHRKVCP